MQSIHKYFGINKKYIAISNKILFSKFKYAILFLASIPLLVNCTKIEQGSNQSASRIDSTSLGFNPLNEKVIASFVNIKKGTMSTLYGNCIAFNHASSNGSPKYPANAILYMVTWKQVPDPRWFGANIPGDVVSIEVVKLNQDPANKIVPVYSCYTGQPLKLASRTLNDNQRIEAISCEKISVVP